MRIWMLATSAAALAITAPALADKGGHGGGHGGGNAAQGQRGGGGERAQTKAQSRNNGGDRAQAKAGARMNGGHANRQSAFAQTDNRGHGQRAERVRVQEKGQVKAFHGQANDHRQAIRSARVEDRGNRG